MQLEAIDEASESGFEQSMLKALPALRRFAAACVEAADREDLVQDTLARALVKRATFDQERGGLQSWLLAIMADQARQRWRRRPTPWLRPEATPQIDRHPSEFSNVTVAVNRLPRRQREVVVLFYYVDLPVAEIAALLHCTQGTVKSTLHDARRRLTMELVNHER